MNEYLLQIDLIAHFRQHIIHIWTAVEDNTEICCPEVFQISHDAARKQQSIFVLLYDQQKCMC